MFGKGRRDDSDDESASDFSSVKEENLLTFHLLHFISVWTKPGTTKMCIYAVAILPPGVGTEKFCTQLFEGGWELRVTFTWPKPLLELRVLHNKWLKDVAEDKRETFNLGILGF